MKHPHLRRLALAVVPAVAVLAGTASAAASTPPAEDDTSPLGCGVTIWDPGDELDDAATSSAIARTASVLGADVRVRAEQNLDSGLDERLDQLIAQCAGWSSGGELADDTASGELADDMVVVMFSPTEREASVFYGADLGPRLEQRWEDAVDAMIPELRDGDYTEAIDDALQTLRTGASSTYTYSSSSSSTSSSSGSAAPIILLVLIVGVSVAVWLYQLANGNASFSDGNGSTRWSRSYGSRSRSRSWSSSSSSRRSSSSGRRSSGGGSRRAGGGTKKW